MRRCYLLMTNEQLNKLVDDFNMISMLDKHTNETVLNFADQLIHELFDNEEVLEKTLFEYVLLITFPYLLRKYQREGRIIQISVDDILNQIMLGTDLRLDVNTHDMLLNNGRVAHSSYLMNLVKLSLERKYDDVRHYYHDKVMLNADVLNENCDVSMLKELSNKISDKIQNRLSYKYNLSKSEIKKLYKALISDVIFNRKVNK